MTDRLYTTQLQAGLGLIEETRTLLDIWQPHMSANDLFKHALERGCFANISARRLRNIVCECFAPRYLVSGDYPAGILKRLRGILSTGSFAQLMFLFTARANLILADFVRQVYWPAYAGGRDHLSNEDAEDFVVRANQDGKMAKPWSDGTVYKVSRYLTGCIADFGLLESSRSSTRRILHFQVELSTALILAYDLHFSGLGDNAVISHPDWELFGLECDEVRDEFKRLSMKNHLLAQTAGDVIRISWNHADWEELIDVIA